MRNTEDVQSILEKALDKIVVQIQQTLPAPQLEEAMILVRDLKASIKTIVEETAAEFRQKFEASLDTVHMDDDEEVEDDEDEEGTLIVEFDEEDLKFD